MKKRDPKVQRKIKYKLEKYDRLPYNYQSKIGYATLIQTFVLKEFIKEMSVRLVDMDIELKLKISRKKNWKVKNSYHCKFF